MDQPNGQDGDVTEEAQLAPCDHPNDCVVYYSEYDEFDDVYEDYWCAKCLFWLTPSDMMMIRERPNFITAVTEDEIRKRAALPENAPTK